MPISFETFSYLDDRLRYAHVNKLETKGFSYKEVLGSVQAELVELEAHEEVMIPMLPSDKMYWTRENKDQVDTFSIRIPTPYISKSRFMQIDIMAKLLIDCPICFTDTNSEYFLGINTLMRQMGLVYQLYGKSELKDRRMLNSYQQIRDDFEWENREKRVL